MSSVLEALAKAFGQLSDRTVLGVLVKSILITVLIFAVLGVITFAGLTMAFATVGWADSSAAYGGLASAVVAVFLIGVAGWLLFRVVAVGVLQFFADEVVIAVEAQHYPQAAQQARALPFREDLANSLRGIGRTLGYNLLALPVALVLLVTGIGPAVVFLAVNAWLLGRELTDMAWLRHRATIHANPVPRPQRVLLGLIVAGIMLVPFANLIGPVIGAAAGTHLTQRAMAAARGERGDA